MSEREYHYENVLVKYYQDTNMNELEETRAENERLRQAAAEVSTALRWQLNMQEGEINTKISGLRVSERCVAESVVLLEAALAKGEGK